MIQLFSLPLCLPFRLNFFRNVLCACNHKTLLPLFHTGKTHGLRNEMHIGSRSGSGTCFVAFRACAERRNFSHIESRGNNVSEMAHEAVSCSTVCLLSSRCATRGKNE